MGGISNENTVKKIPICILKETQRMNNVATDLSPNKHCFLDIYWCVQENAPFSCTALNS